MANPPEIPKGLKLILGMAGITPEMLQNPAKLLRSFGINPDDVLNQVAEFRQIGLKVEAAFTQCSVRLARIEAHLGIANDPVNGHADCDTAGSDGGELRDMGRSPDHRRN